MLVAGPPPPCPTSWTCAGPNATASPPSSRRRATRWPPGARYCSARQPSATANDPDDPPWSCQSVSWPRSQASSHTSQELDRYSGRYQRTSGSRTTRSAHRSRRAARSAVTARSRPGASRPACGTCPPSTSAMACWRSGLTPQPGCSPGPACPRCWATAPLGVIAPADTRTSWDSCHPISPLLNRFSGPFAGSSRDLHSPRAVGRRYRWASAIQTCPGAKVIRCPDVMVNVVPPPALGRDQRAVQALPSRRTRAVPDPVLFAYGGGLPYSGNREARTVVYWITTVAGDSRAPSIVFAGVPSIDTSQRCLAADQVKWNDAAG